MRLRRHPGITIWLALVSLLAVGAWGAGESLTRAAENPTEQAKKGGGASTFRVYWKEGLRFDSADKAYKFKLGGRIQNDWIFASGDDDLKVALGDPLEDGTEFRRARLYVSGVIYERVEFKAQYDFAGGDADFKDVYIGLLKIPVFGNIRIGHFKEAFSLEELTSSKYITFMERSLPILFAPSRNTGIMAHDRLGDGRLTWALGVFRDADSFGNSSSASGSYNVTGRFTALPWYKEKGKKLLHLGVAYSDRSPEDDRAQFRQRPEIHLSPYFVDTAPFAAGSVRLVGGEVALVTGAFSVQGEYMAARTDFPGGGDATFTGSYVQVSYFLTGEHRKYKTSKAVFDRVKPKRNFLVKGGGPGAWEIAGRYSQVDLDDGGVSGGELTNFTVGVNWYLNPNSRFMWNYVNSELDSVGDAEFFGMRFQVDF